MKKDDGVMVRKQLSRESPVGVKWLALGPRWVLGRHLCFRVTLQSLYSRLKSFTAQSFGNL